MLTRRVVRAGIVGIALTVLLGSCGSGIDVDGDGYSQAEDCNDYDASTHPDALESCDLADNDCDGLVDEDDATNTVTFYEDLDGDGYGSADTAVRACRVPAGFVANDDDCDDFDDRIHPGAAEQDCTDPVDYDCDGRAGADDADGDGHRACTDCNDEDDRIYPGAPEVCDGIDNDCDAQVDRFAIDTPTWFGDLDGDGFGGDLIEATTCDRPAGYVDNDDDCDDLDARVRPGAEELCNDIDDDCDGEVDEDGLDPATWYADVDGDGYGNLFVPVYACAAPTGYVADDTDCDDSNADAFPGATEYCDAFDTDCDGDTIDPESVDASVYYIDRDRDLAGNPAVAITACEPVTGYVEDDQDCNDLDPTIGPLAPEVCDGLDNDCNGVVDDGC